MTYSLDFRQKALEPINNKGMSYHKASALLGVSTRILQNWQANIDIKTKREVKPTKIDDEALLQDVQDYPYETICMNEQDALTVLIWVSTKP